jgi:hypothetical protein
MGLRVDGRDLGKGDSESNSNIASSRCPARGVSVGLCEKGSVLI